MPLKLDEITVAPPRGQKEYFYLAFTEKNGNDLMSSMLEKPSSLRQPDTEKQNTAPE